MTYILPVTRVISTFCRFCCCSISSTSIVDELLAGGVAPGGIVVGSVDELPPSYTSVTGGAPMVTCRVCQVIILIEIVRM